MLTRQEMFDRAYLGLAKQGWRRATSPSGCQYLTPAGLRCAWGHVDPEGTASIRSGGVTTLHREGIGLAKDLPDEDHLWANQLQNAHDLLIAPDDRLRTLEDADDLEAAEPGVLRNVLERFARYYNLTVPEIQS